MFIQVRISNLRPGALPLFLVFLNQSKLRVPYPRGVGVCEDEIARRSLIVEQEEWEHWTAAASADGGTLMLRRSGYGDTNYALSEDHWISTDTLQDLLVDDPKPYYSMLFSINDVGVYFTIKGVEKMYGVHYDPIAFRAKGQTRYSLLCAECTGTPLAVSNSGLLFLDHNPYRDFMLIRNGKVQYRGSYGMPIDRIFEVAVAANSNRFAVQFSHGERSLFTGDTAKDGITVFDADRMQTVLFIKETVYPDKEGYGETWLPGGIAISPDGAQVLVLNGQVLKAISVAGMKAKK